MDDERPVPMVISDSLRSEDSKEWLEKLPVGFRFHPTEEELISYYLAKKVNGQDAGPVSKYIKEVQVYDHDPWSLPELASDFGDGRLYFFNKLNRKCSGLGSWDRYENNYDRIVNQSGHWWKTESFSPVNDQYGKQIGIKKSLAYYQKDQNSGRKMKTRWLMNEYRLLHHGLYKSDPWDWALNVVYCSDSYDSISNMMGSGSSSSSSATPANLDFPRFKQIDDKTALHYLNERASGRINQHIKQLNVYDFQPWALSGFAFDSGSGVMCMCFFTPIKTEQKLPKAFNRIAPGGCWKKTGKIIDIMGNDGKPNGIKTSLAYYKIQGSRKHIKTQWLMKEFIYLGQQSNQTDTWTLCVIYFHDNKGKHCESESGLSGDMSSKRKHCESTVSAEDPDLRGKRHCLSPEVHDQNLGINTYSSNTQHFIFSSNHVGTLQQGLPIPNPGQFTSHPVMGSCSATVSNEPVLNQSPLPFPNFVPDDQLFYMGHQPQPHQQLGENPWSAIATVSTTTDLFDQNMNPNYNFDPNMNPDGLRRMQEPLLPPGSNKSWDLVDELRRAGWI